MKECGHQTKQVLELKPSIQALKLILNCRL